MGITSKEIIFEMLKILPGIMNSLDNLKDGDEIVQEGHSFGDLENDTEIKADKFIGGLLRTKLTEKAEKLEIDVISIEGFEDIEIVKGRYWYCIDPLDGSLNYKLRANTIGLPYCTVVTILDKKDDAIFLDIVAAIVFDLRSGDFWFSHRAEYGVYCSFVNEKSANVMNVHELDLTNSIVIGEMYYPTNRELLFNIFKENKGWLRNSGSAAYEMSLVSSGSAVAYICDNQKQHELGAAYALVKGAGGAVVDFEGNNLGVLPYTFNTQTRVVLAANSQIAQEIVSRIKKFKASQTKEDQSDK